MVEIGDVVAGCVVDVQPFGLFIDVEGVLGLILIPELSWDPVGHPSEIGRLGDRIECKVIHIVPDSGDELARFTASVKALHPEFNPWREPSIFTVGSRFEGTVEKIMSYGIFFRHPSGAWALLHNEDFDNSDVPFDIGDSVDVVIVEVEVEAKQIRVRLV